MVRREFNSLHYAHPKRECEVGSGFFIIYIYIFVGVSDIVLCMMCID